MYEFIEKYLIIYLFHRISIKLIEDKIRGVRNYTQMNLVHIKVKLALLYLFGSLILIQYRSLAEILSWRQCFEIKFSFVPQIVEFFSVRNSLVILVLIIDNSNATLLDDIQMINRISSSLKNYLSNTSSPILKYNFLMYLTNLKIINLGIP